MTQVSINSKTSLPTTTSENKYFYLTNSNYSPYSSYIYICLEDSNFGLSYRSIKYCLTNINPSSNPDSAVSSCIFKTLALYDSISSSSTDKYYYRISIISNYIYTIVQYEGNNSYGNLYVTSHYKYLPSIKMTFVSKNSNESLPTTILQEKYFFLMDKEYYLLSNYIYICLEDTLNVILEIWNN